MKRLLFLAALCALAAAMVPKERRAIEEAETTSPGKRICEPHTPCGWAFYNKIPEMVESTVTNTYCQCDTSKACVIDENDEAGKTWVKRCKPKS